MSDFEGPLRGNGFSYDNDFRAVGLVAGPKGTLLEVVWATPGFADLVVAKGTTVEAALEDGSSLSLKVAEDAAPVANANLGGGFTQWVTRLPVSDRQLNRLAKSGVKALRTVSSGQNITQKVLAEPRARLQTLAICLNDHSRAS